MQSPFRMFAAFLFAAFLSACAHQAAPPSPAPVAIDMNAKPQSMMWVGNSFFYYNNSMHGHFGLLSNSLGDKPAVRSTSVTISGSGLDWHDMESLLRPNGLGRYSFVGDNEIRFNPPTRQYDTVIMMDCSQCPIHPQLQQAFFDTVKKDAQILRTHGVRGVLFMSWAYKDKPEMTKQLEQQYLRAAKENGMLVIPVGPAFAKAIARKPDLELYQPDKRHPSLAGTYLATCTAYATLMHKSPVGASYTAGLPAETAAMLQQVAWETAQEYAKAR